MRESTVNLKPDGFFGIVILILFLGGCITSACQGVSIPDKPSLPIKSTSVPSLTMISSQTPKPKVVNKTPVASNTPTEQITVAVEAKPTRTVLVETLDCQEPEEDYSIITVNGFLLNRRTYLMLQHAAEIYAGEIEITGYAITQGSFHDNGAASFGTHLGGGAVDLSVMRKGTYTILYAEIPTLVNALRIAGFAAWFRELNELFPGSPTHIHAIAIGDKQLSQAAREQLFGESGYFRGFSGIPVIGGTPTPDRFGGPILCLWMREAGYQDESSKK